MNNAVYYVLVIVAGYFCGCIESGYLVGKLCGMDIRDYGSGNSGTTNVLRVLGKTRALLTFLGDALKSFIPVLVVKFLLCPGSADTERRPHSACYRICCSNGT